MVYYDWLLTKRRSKEPWWLRGKESACSAGDLGSIPGSGRSPGEGHGNPLQYSCWEIPWAQEPGGLQSTGSQRVGLNWATSTFTLDKGEYIHREGDAQGKDGLVTRDSCKHHKLEEETENFPLEASKDSIGPPETWFQTSSFWVCGGEGGILFVWSHLAVGTLLQNTNPIPSSAVYTVDQPALKSSSISDFKVIMTIWPFPQFSATLYSLLYSWDVFYFSCSKISYSKIHCFLKYWKWKWSCSVMSDSLRPHGL